MANTKEALRPLLDQFKTDTPIYIPKGYRITKRQAQQITSTVSQSPNIEIVTEHILQEFHGVETIMREHLEKSVSNLERYAKAKGNNPATPVARVNNVKNMNTQKAKNHKNANSVTQTQYCK